MISTADYRRSVAGRGPGLAAAPGDEVGRLFEEFPAVRATATALRERVLRGPAGTEEQELSAKLVGYSYLPWSPIAGCMAIIREAVR